MAAVSQFEQIDGWRALQLEVEDHDIDRGTFAIFPNCIKQQLSKEAMKDEGNKIGNPNARLHVIPQIPHNPSSKDSSSRSIDRRVSA